MFSLNQDLLPQVPAGSHRKSQSCLSPSEICKHLFLPLAIRSFQHGWAMMQWLEEKQKGLVTQEKSNLMEIIIKMSPTSQKVKEKIFAPSNMIQLQGKALSAYLSWKKIWFGKSIVEHIVSLRMTQKWHFTFHRNFLTSKMLHSNIWVWHAVAVVIRCFWNWS